MKARNSNAFDAIKNNEFIKQTFKNSQKMDLEQYLKPRNVKKAEFIWEEGDKVTKVFLISNGKIGFC